MAPNEITRQIVDAAYKLHTALAIVKNAAIAQSPFLTALRPLRLCVTLNCW